MPGKNLLVLFLACSTSGLWADCPNPEQFKNDVPVVHMIYGTDRVLDSNGQFENKNAGTSICYGLCSYTLDVNYLRCDGEKPSWLSFHQKDGTTLDYPQFQPPDEATFVKEFSKKPKKTFVFIHGVNTGFTDAIQRSAQIAYDLQLDGTPILYSWPSADSLPGAIDDQTTTENEKVIGHCVEFLAGVLQNAKINGTKVTFIAHSMGANLLCRALLELDVHNKKYEGALRSVVLIAPGISGKDFTKLFCGGGLRKKYVDQDIPIVAYASPGDLVLYAGQLYFGDSELGQSGSHLTELDGLTMIDTNQINYQWGLSHDLDRHDGVMNDIYLSVNKELPLNERLVTEYKNDQGRYYEIFDGVHMRPTIQDYNFGTGDKYYLGDAGQKDIYEMDWYGLLPDGSFNLQAQARNWQGALGFANGVDFIQLAERYNLGTGHFRPHLGLDLNWDNSYPWFSMSLGQEAGVEYLTDDGWFFDPGVVFQDTPPISINSLSNNVKIFFQFRLGHYINIPL